MPLAAHVALQRIMRNTKKSLFRPKRFMGKRQFVEYTRKQTDKKKTLLRYQYTCLRMHKKCLPDSQLVYACYTKKELREAKCRVGLREKAKRCGLRVRKGTAIHHRDHNACNNRCSNLQVMTDREHQRHHSKKNVFAGPCQQMMREFSKILTK